MGHELQTIVESLVNLGLERVIVVGGVIRIVSDVLRPAILVEERSPLVPGNSPKTDDCGLIHVEVRIVRGKSVAIVTHKRKFH